MEDKAKQLENEKELVERAKTDEAAFNMLYAHYFPKIYSYVIKRAGSQEVAEDVVSEVFLKTFVNIKKYNYQGFTFGAWVYRIATNCLVDYYRKQNRRGEIFSEDDLKNEPARESLKKEVENKSDRQVIEKVLIRLPARYAQVIYLRYFAEMEIFEIAETMKVPKAHASVLIHRALESFKKECAKREIKFFSFFIF